MTDATTNPPASTVPSAEVPASGSTDAQTLTEDNVDDLGRSQDFEATLEEMLNGGDGDDGVFADLADEGEESSADDQDSAQAGKVPAEGDEAAGETKEAPPAAADPEASAPAEPTTADQDARPTDQPVDTAQVESQLNEALSQYKVNAAELLAEQVYQLTDEDAQALDEDPAEALKRMVPQIASRVHVEAQLAAVQMMLRTLPQFLQNYSQTMTRAETFENKFFDKWPALKEHGNTVTQIARSFRAVNPQATPDQVIDSVGLQAMIQLKLPLESILATPPEAQQQQQQPFKPVAAQAAPAPKRAPSGAANPFAAMVDSWEEEM